ncbi:MAG: OmpA family protein [Pseudomonadota bacterium]
MSFLTRRKGSNESAQENPYWMSFSDIMAGLLVIFILVCTALLLQLSEVKDKVLADSERLHEATRARSAILHEIKEELVQSGIFVTVVDNDSVLRIPEETFHFDTGSYEIPKDRQDIAQKIGQVLYETIVRGDRWQHLETVFIEGHSDKRVARRYRMGNWELSTLRAISLWQFWLEQEGAGIALDTLLNTNGQNLFSVSGYGATRPAEKGETLVDSEEAMRKDRRIDIRFTTKQLSEKDLNNMIAPLQGN